MKLRNLKPLGIRLHNLGNLRAINNRSNYWAHQTGISHGFCVFDSDYYGIRALCKQLHTYYKRNWLKNAKTFVSHYAPACDGNNESAYVDFVCSAWSDKFYPIQLAILIMQIEQGEKYITVQHMFFAGLHIRHFFSGENVLFESAFDGMISLYRLQYVR